MWHHRLGQVQFCCPYSVFPESWICLTSLDPPAMPRYQVWPSLPPPPTSLPSLLCPSPFCVDFPSVVEKRKCWKRCQTALEAEMLYLLNSERQTPTDPAEPWSGRIWEGGGGNCSSHPFSSRSSCQHRRRGSHPCQLFFYNMDLVPKVRDIFYTNTDQFPAICLFLCSI